MGHLTLTMPTQIREVLNLCNGVQLCLYAARWRREKMFKLKNKVKFGVYTP